jgi:hypothetical protein
VSPWGLFQNLHDDRSAIAPARPARDLVERNEGRRRRLREPGEEGIVGERHPIAGCLAAAGWMLFPLVPAVLGRFHYEQCNASGADPRLWDTASWLILTGPLWGFGFLAGATAGIADPPGRRGVRSLPARRALWVAVGPWSGMLVVIVLLYGISWAEGAMEWLSVHLFGLRMKSPLPTLGSTGFAILFWAALITAAYGWLVGAVAALRRARRQGQFRAALARGLATAVAFVGSLFGSFWAATAAFRGYFFDPTIAG